MKYHSRKRRLNDAQAQEVYKRYKSGEPFKSLCSSFGVSDSTIYREIRRIALRETHAESRKARTTGNGIDAPAHTWSAIYHNKDTAVTLISDKPESVAWAMRALKIVASIADAEVGKP